MKKVMVTVISLATLGLGTIVPLQVNAQPINHHENGFQVQDRRHRQQPWVNVGGCVSNRHEVDQEVKRLKHEGYQARLVQCRIR